MSLCFFLFLCCLLTTYSFQKSWSDDSGQLPENCHPFQAQPLHQSQWNVHAAFSYNPHVLPENFRAHVDPSAGSYLPGYDGALHTASSHPGQSNSGDIDDYPAPSQENQQQWFSATNTNETQATCNSRRPVFPSASGTGPAVDFLVSPLQSYLLSNQLDQYIASLSDNVDTATNKVGADQQDLTAILGNGFQPRDVHLGRPSTSTLHRPRCNRLSSGTVLADWSDGDRVKDIENWCICPDCRVMCHSVAGYRWVPSLGVMRTADLIAPGNTDRAYTIACRSQPPSKATIPAPIQCQRQPGAGEVCGTHLLSTAKWSVARGASMEAGHLPGKTIARTT